ncbi:MAG TPA: hypothetical protein VK563_13055 [Puia sp.]|nr:hypothetical protein [Puia sp.]
MKLKILSRPAILALALGSFFLVSAINGCKKSSDSSSGSGPSGISATLGGTAYQSTSVIGVMPNSDSYVFMAGLKVVNGDTLVLEIDIPDTVKVNHVDDVSAGGFMYTDFHTGKSYAADGFWGHGIVTVTSWDTAGHKIAGVFSGVMQNTSGANDSLVVTNGHFNNTYLITP